MNPLPGTPEAPAHLTEAHLDWTWEVAWQYGPPVVTYKISRGTGEERFLKVAREGGHPSLAAEAQRMSWAGDHLPVPSVLSHGSSDGIEWLLTPALPGVDATHADLSTDFRRLVGSLARGLRRFHEAEVDLCPFDFRLDTALAHARSRGERGLIDPATDFHPEFSHLGVHEALQTLERQMPQTEDLVVCHGDYCLPNVLLTDWEVTGFVDLGELGVADRWWDLAVATWSVTWNLGPGYEDLFLADYGVARDESRVTFYRLLYDLVS